MKTTESTTFSKDTIVILYIIANSLLVGINVLQVLVRLRVNETKIPIQYIAYNYLSGQSNTPSTGNWYILYSLALVALAGWVISAVLAHRIYKSNKVFSYAILSVYTVVAVYSAFVIHAILTYAKSF